MLKLLLINIGIIFLLLFSLEIFCRINSNYHFFNFTHILNHSQDNILHLKLDANTLQKEYGKDVLQKIPNDLISHFDLDKFKNFSYEDIDHSVNPDRFWRISDETQNRSSQFSKKIKNTDIEIYNVTYTYNKFSKRFVEGQDKKNQAKKFILAAGDSFTFGEGVNQGRDYPSQLASIISDEWKVYNYGIPGDSANDFYLRTLANPGYFDQIIEPEGDFLWVFHDAQMKRLLFPLNSYKNANYILNKPEFTLSDGNLIYHEFFASSTRPYRQLLNLLGHSEIPQTFNLEIPSLLTENSFKLFFTLLNNSILRIESRGVKVKRRVIVNYFTHKNFSQFSEIAKTYGFEVINFEKLIYQRDLKNGGDVQMTIPLDGHPSAEAYWLLSRVLKYKFY